MPPGAHFAPNGSGASARAACCGVDAGVGAIHLRGRSFIPARFPAAIFSCYIEVARHVGLDPYEILRRANIDPRWISDPEALLPLSSIVQVLEESARRSGRDDIGILLAECRTFASLGPVALLLEHEHTVRDVINAAIEFRPVLAEPLNIRLEQSGSLATIVFEVPPAYATAQLANNVVGAAHGVLCDAFEGNWKPSVAHFRHAVPHCLESFQRFFRCQLEFDSSLDGLSFPTETLDIVSPAADAELAGYARRLLNLLPEMSGWGTFTAHVRTAIYLALRTGEPSLRRVAANLGTSSRSVQRNLAQEGETFASVQNATRRDLAMRYLAQSAQSITEIAHSLGYSNASSFSRWFLEQFGVSPSDWRRQRIEQQRVAHGWVGDQLM